MLRDQPESVTESRREATKLAADRDGTEENAMKSYLPYVEERFLSTAARCGQIRRRSSDFVTDSGYIGAIT
jgi:hypothetical protein